MNSVSNENLNQEQQPQVIAASIPKGLNDDIPLEQQFQVIGQQIHILVNPNSSNDDHRQHQYYSLKELNSDNPSKKKGQKMFYSDF